jgi:DNA replication protein DnaC
MGRKDAWQAAAEEYSRRHINTCCCGGAGYVTLSVPVGHLLFGKPVPCVCRRDALAGERARRLRRMSGLSDGELSSSTFATFDPQVCRPMTVRPMVENGAEQVRTTDPAETRTAMRAVLDLCQGYAADPHGWLVLVGGYGTGKTHLARAVCHELLNRGRQPYMANMPDLLAMLRSGYDDEVVDFDTRFEWLARTDLLVIDDLGAEAKTDWASEQLYRLVNRRYDERRPLLVTSNCGLEQIESRIASRLAEGARVPGGWSRIVLLPCGDYRPYAMPILKRTG